MIVIKMFEEDQVIYYELSPCDVINYYTIVDRRTNVPRDESFIRNCVLARRLINRVLEISWDITCKIQNILNKIY